MIRRRLSVKMKICLCENYQSTCLSGGVAVSPEMKYTLEIRKIEKGSDDESLDISSY